MWLIQKSQHYWNVILLTMVFFVASVTCGFSEDCPRDNLKARLAYNSGVFWLGRGDYQKAFDLFSEALEICPKYNDAITKQNEVGLVLEEHRKKLRIEEERKQKAQREYQERQRYQQHLQSERDRVYREAREREREKREKQEIQKIQEREGEIQRMEGEIQKREAKAKASTWSLFGPNNPEDCVLHYISKTKSNKGAYYIRNACKEKFSGIIFKGNKKKKIECIFENVPSAQTDGAADVIYRACLSKY